jgi:hypothetical protein
MSKNLIVHDFSKVYRNDIDNIACNTCDMIEEFVNKHNKELSIAQTNKIFETVEQVLLVVFDYPDFRDK